LRVVVAYSINDVAGTGAASKLLELLRCKDEVLEGVPRACLGSLAGREVYVAGFYEDVLYFDFLERVLEADYYIVISRHSAVSGIRSLTVHHTGNPTPRAEYGGRPLELSVANPPIALAILRALRELAREKSLEGTSVTYEVTHHGPTSLSKPLTFAEIGSTPTEWSDAVLQEVLARAVYATLLSEGGNCIPSIGVGGGHYAQQFTERSFNYGECYGHILSRHAVKELRENLDLFRFVVEQAVRRESTEIRRVVLEGKNPSYVKQVVVEVSRKYGIEVVE
jgi:D-aminoacyl-tRNA deacylase